MSTNEPAMRAFKSLSALYDALDGVDITEDLTESGYPTGQATSIQQDINSMLTKLEDILPGLEMNSNGED